MNNFNLCPSKRARKQLKQLKSISKTRREGIYTFLGKLKSNPSSRAVGAKPTPVIGEDCFSKDISRGDRIVYRIVWSTKTVIIYSVLGHYCDNGGRLFKG